jgi:hypothetical protein
LIHHELEDVEKMAMETFLVNVKQNTFIKSALIRKRIYNKIVVTFELKIGSILNLHPGAPLSIASSSYNSERNCSESTLQTAP